MRPALVVLGGPLAVAVLGFAALAGFGLLPLGPSASETLALERRRRTAGPAGALVLRWS